MRAAEEGGAGGGGEGEALAGEQGALQVDGGFEVEAGVAEGLGARAGRHDLEQDGRAAGLEVDVDALVIGRVGEWDQLVGQVAKRRTFPNAGGNGRGDAAAIEPRRARGHERHVRARGAVDVQVDGIAAEQRSGGREQGHDGSAVGGADRALHEQGELGMRIDQGGADRRAGRSGGGYERLAVCARTQSRTAATPSP